MKILTKEQILAIHQRCIEETGGSLGFRDEGMFDSALAQPYQSFSGSELYPTVEQKAARLCYGLVMNHAFIDGNKRIGTMAMLVFLAINGIELEYTQKELSDEILALASGDIGYNDLLDWVKTHSNVADVQQG